MLIIARNKSKNQDTKRYVSLEWPMRPWLRYQINSLVADATILSDILCNTSSIQYL